MHAELLAFWGVPESAGCHFVDGIYATNLKKGIQCYNCWNLVATLVSTEYKQPQLVQWAYESWGLK